MVFDQQNVDQIQCSIHGLRVQLYGDSILCPYGSGLSPHLLRILEIWQFMQFNPTLYSRLTCCAFWTFGNLYNLIQLYTYNHCLLFLCLQLIQLIKPLMLPGVSPLLTSFLTKEQDSLLWLEMAYLNWGLAAFTAFTMAASELVARCFFNRLSISMMAIDINTSAQKRDILHYTSLQAPQPPPPVERGHCQLHQVHRAQRSICWNGQHQTSRLPGHEEELDGRELWCDAGHVTGA